MGNKTVLIAVGTRPEVIKMAPVVRALRKAKGLRPVLVSTAQHREMLDQMQDAFGLRADYDLDIMRRGQQPDEVAEHVLAKLRPVFRRVKPDLVAVQGDTTTAAFAAIAAFYHAVPVAHVEAGLRSHDNRNPFPEEINRALIDRLADLYFVPTKEAKRNLSQENIKGTGIFVTGNTVTDALLWASSRNRAARDPGLKKILRSRERWVLVTAHRRESFGAPLERIFKGILDIVKKRDDVRIVYPVHLNPRVRTVARRMLRHPRITLLEPLDYFDMIRVMKRAELVLSDSGGIQEEAPALNKPVLILRDVTERRELIKAGGGLLVGSSPGKIVRESLRLLNNPRAYRRMASARNPYGDGRAGERIARAMRWYFGMGARPNDW